MSATTADLGPSRAPEAGQPAPAACLLGALVYGLAVVAILLPFEFEHYASLLRPAPEGAVQAAVLLVIAGKSIALLVPGWLAVLALLWLGRPLAGRRLGALWASFVAVWLTADLAVQTVTANSLLYYASYLGETDALHWAGAAGGLTTLFRDQSLERGLLLAVALCGSALAARLSRRLASERAAKRASGALALACALTLSAGPALERALPPARIFLQLNDTMPLRWNLGFGPSGEIFANAERRIAELYARYFDSVHVLPGRLVPRQKLPLDAPNVILIVLESFRHDVVTEDVMPRLDAWSRNGVRADQHYSMSNNSHQSMFSLVYGQHPLNYAELVTAGQPPTLPDTLRRAGYEIHHFTAADLQWKLMNTFLGPPHFQLHIEDEGPNWRRDRRTLAAVRELLDEPWTGPRLVLVFLMSTHWNYSQPAEYAEAHDAGAAAAAALAGADPVLLASYRGAARYLDDLMGDWLASIDLGRNIVVVTGDHGESLFDDGSVAHGSRLSLIQTRVPMLIAGPGIPAATRISTPTSHQDLTPTLLRLAGFAPDRLVALPGTAWFADRSGRTNEPGADYAAASMYERDGSQILGLLSEDTRFSLLLDRSTRSARLLGPIGVDGIPSEQPLSRAGSEILLRWFQDFLARASRVARARGL